MIIENLLRFARPSGKRNFKEFDLTTLLRETLDLIIYQARIQKIDLRFHMLTEPIMINDISGLLQKAFMNLLLNAIKAMPDGGVLGVDLGQTDDVAWVLISDTGQGIAARDLENIFDPFYTTTPVGQGTGLGLSICYSIIKQHTGTITAESLTGKGTTFTVRLLLT
jgi:signal transduction histidine kinase